MSTEFTPIETQEALDKIVQERVNRATEKAAAAAREEVKKSFEGYVSPDEVKKNADQTAAVREELEKTKAALAEMTGKAETAQIVAAKLRIAQEYGVPFELADRLKGSTEEELKADAEVFTGSFPKRATPNYNAEKPQAEDTVKADMRRLLEGLTARKE